MGVYRIHEAASQQDLVSGRSTLRFESDDERDVLAAYDRLCEEVATPMFITAWEPLGEGEETMTAILTRDELLEQIEESGGSAEDGG